LTHLPNSGPEIRESRACVIPGSRETSLVGDLENSREEEQCNDEADEEVDLGATSRAPVSYLEQKKNNMADNLVLLKRVSERLQLTTEPSTSFKDWDVDAITQAASAALAAVIA